MLRDPYEGQGERVTSALASVVPDGRQEVDPGGIEPAQHFVQRARDAHNVPTVELNYGFVPALVRIVDKW